VGSAPALHQKDSPMDQGEVLFRTGRDGRGPSLARPAMARGANDSTIWSMPVRACRSCGVKIRGGRYIDPVGAIAEQRLGVKMATNLRGAAGNCCS